MRSSGNGPFGVLLLAAPLVAVPLLAIFGIPQFAPGVDAGSLTEQTDVGFDDDSDLPRQSKNRRRSSVDDLFDPLEETTGDDLAAQGSGSDDWEPPPEALKGFRMARPEEQFADASSSEEWFEKSRNLELEESESDEFDRGQARQGLKKRNRENEEKDYDRPPNSRRIADVESGESQAEPQDEATEGSSRSDDQATGPGMGGEGAADSVVVEEFSWRQASRRLRELGDNVKHYFDYDIEKETYVFHCELSPPDDTGVVQEFHAQGHEPLTTVREVVKQVELWAKNRKSSLAKVEKRSSDRSR